MPVAEQNVLPAIAPCQDRERPLFSVMIPTYNSDDTLPRTLESVLSQDPGPALMQIEVVDDASPRGDAEALVARIGGGRGGCYRREANGGHVANFNTCLARSRGRLVHLLHGDDWIEPGFYERMRVAFEARPDLGHAFCRSTYRDTAGATIGLTDAESAEPGVIEGWIARILEQQRICTPSVVVRREVYEVLGGFDPRFRTAGEDWEMWARIAASYPVWYEPQALACYSMTREGSLTGAAHGTHRVTRDMRRACEIIESRVAPLLPPGEARRHLRQARLLYAGWSLNYAEAEIGTVGVRAMLPHLREAFLCFPSLWMARRIAKIVLRRPLD